MMIWFFMMMFWRSSVKALSHRYGQHLTHRDNNLLNFWTSLMTPGTRPEYWRTWIWARWGAPRAIGAPFSRAGWWWTRRWRTTQKTAWPRPGVGSPSWSWPGVGASPSGDAHSSLLASRCACSACIMLLHTFRDTLLFFRDQSFLHRSNSKLGPHWVKTPPRTTATYFIEEVRQKASSTSFLVTVAIDHDSLRHTCDRGQ